MNGGHAQTRQTGPCSISREKATAGGHGWFAMMPVGVHLQTTYTHIYTQTQPPIPVSLSGHAP